MRKFALILLAVVFSFVSCQKTEDDGRITIVTTTGIIGDCVEQIVGDKAEVVSLMGAGVDPHLYKASQGDIVKLSSADVIIYNGLHLEGKMAQMLENYSESKPTFAIGNYVHQDQLKKVDNTSDLVDPHIWFNPQLWLQGLGGIAKELDKIEGLDSIYENYMVYAQQILEIEQGLKEQLNTTLREESRILITSHDAFAYFGDAFSFKVRGLQGISTAAEYGAKDVKDLIDFIVENNIKSVFVETSVSNKNLEAVLEGANARGYSLQIGGTLFSDALGEQGKPAGTYKGMLEQNIKTIINGLK